MVASGINDGANLGDDVLYSGTVAAAHRGALPRLAGASPSRCARAPAAGGISRPPRAWRGSWSSGCSAQPLEAATDPERQHSGRAVSRRSRASRARGWASAIARMPVMPARDPRGHAGLLDRAGRRRRGCRRRHRFHAVASGYVSVTPLSIDLTRHAALPARRALAAAAVNVAMNDPRFSGIGMTSARTRDRLVQRLREQGITQSRRCSSASATCRGISSSMRRSRAVPMRIRRCRSASGRRSRSPTSSRA